MTCALAEVRHLCVRYVPERGTPVLALDNVSLRIGQGEVLGILGESGSGKSTLVAAMLRLLPASAEVSGSILLEDCELTEMDSDQLRKIRGHRISIVPQDPAMSLNPIMRAGTQVSEVLRAHLELTRAERKVRVRELLGEVGFDDPERIADSYPHQLSGGQRQRVVIAQAIACSPALVVADEATSKLDPALQMQIQSLMSAIVRRHGTALIWITHDPATLAGFADNTAVMQAGRIVEHGATTDLFRKPAHPYTRTL
ncbi:MAG TPA: ABC transporter ATP-binding protein, partial [Terriglobales bacterium]|nr:ABC transporter ATP-binding protein [Terriglobales bacterium]